MSTPSGTTAVTRTLKQNEYLFREGDSPTAIYIIKSGTISIQKRKGISQVELARLFSNEVLGEISFFDRNPRSASAKAIVETQVLEISFDSLDKIYAKIPDYFKTIMAAVAERLRKANETVRKLQNETTPSPETEVDPSEVLEATAGISNEASSQSESE